MERDDALELCGIISREGGSPLRVDTARRVEFRDLVALVRPTAFAPVEPSESRIADYRAVVESAFQSHAVIPSPFGTVFRHEDALIRWLELHYFTLTDALHYVRDRQVARVYVSHGRQPAVWDTSERVLRGGDLEAAAFDSFRVLKRAAVAFHPVELAQQPRDQGAEGAFLVEREQWNAFTAMVKEEQRRLPDLRFDQTGPWPAYDFVRLELRG